VAERQRGRASSQLRNDNVDVARLPSARQQRGDGAQQTAGRRKTHLLRSRTQVRPPSCSIRRLAAARRMIVRHDEGVTGQLTDTPTRGLPTRRLDISRTGQLADWTTRDLADAAKRTTTKHAKSPMASARCPVRESSRPRVGVSASCPVTDEGRYRTCYPCSLAVNTGVILNTRNASCVNGHNVGLGSYAVLSRCKYRVMCGIRRVIVAKLQS